MNNTIKRRKLAKLRRKQEDTIQLVQTNNIINGVTSKLQIFVKRIKHDSSILERKRQFAFVNSKNKNLNETNIYYIVGISGKVIKGTRQKPFKFQDL